MTKEYFFPRIRSIITGVFGFFTCFQLFFVFIIINSQKTNKAIASEVKNRRLN